MERSDTGEIKSGPYPEFAVSSAGSTLSWRHMQSLLVGRDLPLRLVRSEPWRDACPASALPEYHRKIGPSVTCEVTRPAEIARTPKAAYRRVWHVWWCYGVGRTADRLPAGRPCQRWLRRARDGYSMILTQYGAGRIWRAGARRTAYTELGGSRWRVRMYCKRNFFPTTLALDKLGERIRPAGTRRPECCCRTCNCGRTGARRRAELRTTPERERVSERARERIDLVGLLAESGRFASITRRCARCCSARGPRPTA
jgi:hypothetical protein